MSLLKVGTGLAPLNSFLTLILLYNNLVFVFLMSTNHSRDGCLRQTCNFHCLQGNMRRSKVSLLTLMGDIADKSKYPNGIDILFPNGTT